MLGIYTRISKDRPNQLSTEVQKEQGISLAKTLKLSYKLFEEKKGTSGGKKVEERPKLNEMVDGIYDGTITAVYFYNQDRSARDEVTWFTLANQMKEQGVKLYENGHFVDLDDDDVYMMAGFKAVMDANFRRKTGTRIKASLLKLVEMGKATNPVIHYGYKKDENGFLVLDNEESGIVKEMFEWSLSSIGSQKIANKLNDRGTKTRYGKNGNGTITSKNYVSEEYTTKDKKSVMWSGQTVLQLIKSTWFIGDRPYKGGVYDVPALFDKEYWQKVNDNLQNNRLYSHKLESHRFLLRGILKCNCGCNMYGKEYLKKNENYYKCSSYRVRGKFCGNPAINRPHLDTVIWERFFKNEELTELVIKHFEKTDEIEMNKSLKIELEVVQIELKKNDKEKNKVITHSSKDLITDDEFEIQLSRIRTERNAIETKILNIENQIKTYSNIIQSSNDITTELKSFKNTNSYNDRQIIIKKYVKQIKVEFKLNHFAIEISFNIPNFANYYQIIHRRFYYAIEPFSNDIMIINQRARIVESKVVPETEEEFFKRYYNDKTAMQVFEIKNDFLKDIMNYL